MYNASPFPDQFPNPLELKLADHAIALVLLAIAMCATALWIKRRPPFSQALATNALCWLSWIVWTALRSPIGGYYCAPWIPTSSGGPAQTFLTSGTTVCDRLLHANTELGCQLSSLLLIPVLIVAVAKMADLKK